MVFNFKIMFNCMAFIQLHCLKKHDYLNWEKVSGNNFLQEKTNIIIYRSKMEERELENYDLPVAFSPSLLYYIFLTPDRRKKQF